MMSLHLKEKILVCGVLTISEHMQTMQTMHLSLAPEVFVQGIRSDSEQLPDMCFLCMNMQRA